MHNNNVKRVEKHKRVCCQQLTSTYYYYKGLIMYGFFDNRAQKTTVDISLKVQKNGNLKVVKTITFEYGPVKYSYVDKKGDIELITFEKVKHTLP